MNNAVSDSILDEDILEMLTIAHKPIDIDNSLQSRMKAKLMQGIITRKEPDLEAFTTISNSNDEGWIEAFPGGSFKVLNGDPSIPNSLLSYLIKLEAGFKTDGHDHPFDEETLMLEGDLTLGDITFNTGDYHFAAAGSFHGNVSTLNGCMAFMRGALPV